MDVLSDHPEAEDRSAGRMTLVEHLAELRRRLIVSIAALAVGGVIAFLLYNQILSFLVAPYRHITHSRGLIITDPLEGFATRLKVAGWSGLFLASPVVLWELWRFITPGLHPKEKRYAIPFIVASILLFLMGAAVALITFQPALRFLLGVGGHQLRPFLTPSKYLSLIMLMIIAFGLSFEFPIVLVFLEMAGVLPSAKLKRWRRYAFLIIVIIAAVITPSQDPISLFAMAIPMYIFYEGAIIVGRLLKK